MGLFAPAIIEAAAAPTETEGTAITRFAPFSSDALVEASALRLDIRVEIHCGRMTVQTTRKKGAFNQCLQHDGREEWCQT